MLRLLIDENFDQRILRGLRLEVPAIDYIVVQETKLKGLRDPLLLAWAAENQRIIVTHDVNTMPNGDQWISVTTKVEDPVYFSRYYMTSSDFKKLPDATGWNPTPCSAR